MIVRYPSNRLMAKSVNAGVALFLCHRFQVLQSLQSVQCLLKPNLLDVGVSLLHYDLMKVSRSLHYLSKSLIGRSLNAGVAVRSPETACNRLR